MPNMIDAQTMMNDQSTLSFLRQQSTFVETRVYQHKYPSIQYPGLVPIDTSADEFASSVTYEAADTYGQADFINGGSDDIPLVGTTLQQFETPVAEAAVGYDWSWIEIGKALRLGINLPDRKAFAARRAYEEMIDRIALKGDAGKKFHGLFNHPSITPVPAPNGDWGVVGAPGSATPQEMIDDVNAAIMNIFNGTNTVEIANRLLLPWSKWALLSQTVMSTQDSRTVLNFIRENNVLTAMTGERLDIRGVRELDTIGVSGQPRMIAYRYSDEVLKMHVPMPFRFLQTHQSGPLRYVVPAVWRLGGLDIRLPRAVVYMDGV